MAIDFRKVMLQHEYVLVRPLKEPEQIEGSVLFRPEASRGHQQRGVVVAVGPGEALPIERSWIDRLLGRTPRRPIALAVGDLAFYGKYAGFALEEREQFFVMRDLEIPVFLKQGTFTIVEHDTPEEGHLLGDYCGICAEKEKAALRVWMEDERARLRDELPVVEDEPVPPTLGDA